jgi:hypothetical protein
MFLEGLLNLQILKPRNNDDTNAKLQEQRVVFVWIGSGFGEEAMILSLFANHINEHILLKLVEIKYLNDINYY